MFTVEDHGSIVLIRPLTEDVREWLNWHTAGIWVGGALCVEPRYAEDIVHAMADEGWVLQ